MRGNRQDRHRQQTYPTIDGSGKGSAITEADGVGNGQRVWAEGNGVDKGQQQTRQTTVNNQQLMGVAKATTAGKERGMQETAMVARHKYFIQY